MWLQYDTDARGAGESALVGRAKPISTPCRSDSQSCSRTVQGYAAQEKSVLTSVIEARAKATQIKVDASDLTDPAKIKAFQDAQNQLTGALGRLLAVSEKYPDLKSNANFLALQSQLENTENGIAVTRRDYIDAVRAYNLSLRTFPTLLWAKTFFLGNKPMAEFTASEGSEKPPPVKF